MTDKARSFFSINLGHVVTCLITLGAALVGYGRLEQRVSSLEHRSEKVEQDLPTLAQTVSKMDGKLDTLLILIRQNANQKINP